MKAPITSITYYDDHLVVTRQGGTSETHKHPPVVGDNADTSTDWRKEIVDELRAADAKALAEAEAEQAKGR